MSIVALGRSLALDGALFEVWEGGVELRRTDEEMHWERCPNGGNYGDQLHSQAWYECEPCSFCGQDEVFPGGCDCPKHHPEIYDADGSILPIEVAG